MVYNDTNATDLFWNIEKDNKKLVRELLEQGTITFPRDNITLISTLNWDNETAAHIAVQYGNLEMLTYLLSKEILLLEAKDKWGQTVPLLAAKKGFVHILQYLVTEKRIDLISGKYNLKGNTPIHVAAEEGHVNVIKWYLEDYKYAKGNPDLKNSRGETLAMSAVRKRQQLVFEYLFEDGYAQPFVVDNQDQTVLFHAAMVGSLKAITYIFVEIALKYYMDARNLAGMTVLFVATRFNHLDVVKYFVEERNATIDAPNNIGWTPLHEAACEGHLDIVKYLVEKKADLNRKEMQGRIPVQVAKNKNVIQYLRQAAMETQKPVNQMEKNRTRRSLSESSVSHLTHLQTPILCRWVQEKINDQFSSSIDKVDKNKASSALGGINYTLNSDSFLMFAGACARYMSGVGYERTQNEALLSPRDLLHNRVDPIALDIIDAIPDFEYLSMNND